MLPDCSDRFNDLQFFGGSVVAIEFDDQGQPIWLTTDKSKYGWLVVIDGDQILLEDADGKTDGASVSGLCWVAHGSSIVISSDATVLEALAPEQMDRLRHILANGNDVEETMWCSVCQRHTYPNDRDNYWSECGHLRWTDSIGSWIGVGDWPSVPGDNFPWRPDSVAALIALCDALEPDRYYVVAPGGRGGHYESTPAGRDRLALVLSQGFYSHLSELLGDLDADEDSPDVGPLISWLLTLDDEAKIPQGWDVARQWLTNTTKEIKDV